MITGSVQPKEVTMLDDASAVVYLLYKKICVHKGKSGRQSQTDTHQPTPLAISAKNKQAAELGHTLDRSRPSGPGRHPQNTALRPG